MWEETEDAGSEVVQKEHVHNDNERNPGRRLEDGKWWTGSSRGQRKTSLDGQMGEGRRTPSTRKADEGWLSEGPAPPLWRKTAQELKSWSLGHCGHPVAPQTNWRAGPYQRQDDSSSSKTWRCPAKILQEEKLLRSSLLEELSPHDGQMLPPMSEETKNIVFEQGNIEEFEIMELTRFNAKYVTDTCQLEVLAVTLKVLFQVPAMKFTNKSLCMSFRTSIS